MACIKEKASVFESPQIQVGVLSKLIYHEMTNRYFLKLLVVVGNKTSEPMHNCELEYDGHYSMSMWT